MYRNMQIMQNLTFYHRAFLFRITQGVLSPIYCTHCRNTLYSCISITCSLPCIFLSFSHSTSAPFLFNIYLYYSSFLSLPLGIVRQNARPTTRSILKDIIRVSRPIGILQLMSLIILDNKWLFIAKIWLILDKY